MEGSRRGLVAWLVATLVAAVLIAGASGCGGGDDGPEAATAGTQTRDPEATFAPLVEVAADEPWRPMSARWFIERSQFRFAEDDGCDDRLIAVGRTMPELQNPTIDWIFPRGLGGGPAYYRDPYDASCDDYRDVTLHANQLTRPHDPGPRAEGARPGEGFYLDLADDARGGPVLGEGKDVPVYAERSDEGDGGVRLTYWMLFGMRETPGEAVAREGDWRRIDVVLRDRGDDRYEPLAVQVDTAGDVAWSAVGRVDGTHPVVRLERASHRPLVAAPSERCADCVEWKAWDVLSDARAQLWYGFGGAWGEPGRSDATTGPLGPHRYWQTHPDS